MGRSNAKSSTKAKRKAVEQDETGGSGKSVKKSRSRSTGPPVAGLSSNRRSLRSTSERITAPAPDNSISRDFKNVWAKEQRKLQGKSSAKLVSCNSNASVDPNALNQVPRECTSIIQSDVSQGTLEPVRAELAQSPAGKNANRGTPKGCNSSSEPHH